MTKSDGSKRVPGAVRMSTPTPVRRETSALISLEELLLLEQSRIRDEEAQRRADEERFVRQRMEAEAKAEEAERAQLRAEDETRREATRLDEARRGRIEAEGLAAIAAARVHAESQAKLAMMQVVHHQSIELAGATKRDERSNVVARVALGVVLVSVLGALGFYLERAQSRAQGLQVALTRAESERDERDRKIAHMVPQEERDTLNAKLKSTEDELQNLRAVALAGAKSGMVQPRGAVGVRAQVKPSGADPCAFYRKLRETSPHDPRLFDPANGCL